MSVANTDTGSDAGFLPSAQFDKQTITVVELAQTTMKLLGRRPNLFALYVQERVPASLREEIFVSVSRQSECRYCTYLHEDWARWAGVSDDELAAIGQVESDHFSRRNWLAVQYACAQAANEFETIDAALQGDVDSEFSEQEQLDYEILARVITIFNRLANTVDSTYLQLMRQRTITNRFSGELIVATVMFAGMLAVVPGWSLLRRKSPLAFLKGFGEESMK